MKVSESGYTKDELLDIVDKYLAEQSRRWNFIEEKGDGMYVYDEEGNEYLDFFGGIAVNSTGNCNKKVAAAIADQCQNVIHASNYAYTLPMILLAKKICETIGMEKVLPWQNLWSVISNRTAGQCMSDRFQADASGLHICRVQ